MEQFGARALVARLKRVEEFGARALVARLKRVEEFGARALVARLKRLGVAPRVEPIGAWTPALRVLSLQ